MATGSRYAFFLTGLGVIGLFFANWSSCQESLRSRTQAATNTGVEVTVETYAGTQELLDESALFFYEIFQSDYQTHIDELNKYMAGEVDEARKPYIDSWYPESKGGTNIWGALDKYDQGYR